jgi:hypothetical protein
VFTALHIGYVASYLIGFIVDVLPVFLLKYLISKYTQKMTAFWNVAPYSLVEVCDISEVRTASVIGLIALMMAAVNTSETSVNFYGTIRCNMPEGYHLLTRRLENLKSHIHNYNFTCGLCR